MDQFSVDVDINSTFRYYLLNRLSLALTALATDTEDHIDGNNNDEIDRALLVGFTYRLK